MKWILSVFFILFFVKCVSAQLYGTVTDNEGNPLQSASIYIAGSTSGVNTNVNGYYSLNLAKGESEVIFQYIGYKTVSKKINYTGVPLKLNITLEAQSLEIAEVEINASGEDPAYAIIRNAIANREYFKNHIKSYSCDVYIKGNQKIVKIPQKLMGEDLGNLGGILDTNRQGIIYLSESLSKFYFQAPDKTREEIISSKVSGDSRGFSFNRATAIRFSFYDVAVDFGRQLISPIAPEALLFYKYRLEGSFFDSDGREVNKIKVIPRNESGPVFRGDIFIYENTWNIHSCHLGVTGKSINQEILDTMWLSQQYVPGNEQGQWVLFSQNIEFGLGLLGIKIKGFFTAVFGNYSLNNNFDNTIFSKELVKIEAGSNKKSDIYWDTLRPIPLLAEESRDFHRKDSLEVIWNSKAFRDSIDRKNNKFTSNNLTFGYTYHDSFRRWSLNVGSPLTTIEFNPVQGFYSALNVKYRKWKDDNNTSWFSLGPEVSYGFSDKKWRGALEFERLFNKLHYNKLALKLGKITAQYNETNPISATVNGLYNLYGKLNYMKLYDKTFGKVSYEQRLWHTLKLNLESEYAIRSGLDNSSNYSFRKKSDVYSPNFPGDTVGILPKHHYIGMNASITWFPGIRYVTYPDQVQYFNQSLPVITFRYYLKKVLSYTDGSNGHYTIQQPEITVKYDFYPRFLGTTNISITGGTSIYSGNKAEIIDYKHFKGNQTFIAGTGSEGFSLLPYYDYSTLGTYAEVHARHNFGGFFLSKIPLIKELKFEENITTNMLFQENGFRYTEISAGLSNIGWSIFRLFRVDYTWVFLNGKRHDSGITVGIKLPIAD